MRCTELWTGREGGRRREERRRRAFVESVCATPLGERVEERIGIGKQKMREKRCTISPFPFLCVLLVDESFFTSFPSFLFFFHLDNWSFKIYRNNFAKVYSLFLKCNFIYIYILYWFSSTLIILINIGNYGYGRWVDWYNNYYIYYIYMRWKLTLLYILFLKSFKLFLQI